MNNPQMAGGFTSQNYGDSEALNLRINTDPLLYDIELILKGLKEERFYDSESDKVVTKIVQIGEPLANSIGIQNIMKRAKLIINPHVVQGNLEKDEIYEIMFDFCDKLAIAFTSHSNEWGIKKDMRQEILNTIELCIRGFISRTRDNKERESYNQTFRVLENSTINNREQINKKSAWNFFGSNNGNNNGGQM